MKHKLETPKTNYQTPRIHTNTNSRISECDLKQVLTLITSQSKQYCHQIKDHLYKQLNFNIRPNTIMEDFNNITVNQLKYVTMNLNKDLKKILSLIKIYTMQNNQRKNTIENNNDNLALKMGLIVKELAQQIKKIRSNHGLKLLTANMHFLNLISLLKALSQNIFGYQPQKQEYKQLLNQVKSKGPHFQDLYYNKTENLLSKDTYKQKQVNNRYKQEIEDLIIENCKMKEMFEQQMEVLKQVNKKLKDELEDKICYIQKNEQDYIVYIKKYNILIDKLKTTNLSYEGIIKQLEQERIQLKEENLRFKKNNHQLHKELQQSKLITPTKKYFHTQHFQDTYEDYTTATKNSMALFSHRNNKSK